MTYEVAIIGGGISGLSAAYYLQKLAKERNESISITLFESSDRLGGKIKTIQNDGYVIECGPDSILKRKVEGINLMEDLGLGSDIVANQTGKSYILKDGKLHSMPEGAVMGVPTKLSPFISSTLFSFSGKMRAAADLVIPKSNQVGDISVGHFFRRRLGNEVVDHLISPLLSGIYAGNIDNLSLKSTLPQFLQTEEKYGSLIRGLGKGKSKTPSPKSTSKKEGMFITLGTGLESLVKALELALSETTIIKETAITQIEKNEGRYTLLADQNKKYQADAVILATPHDHTAQVLQEAPYLVQPNREKNTSVATVVLAYPIDKVKLEKEGTGFVVSRKEPVSFTATTWTNQKWPHTAPQGKALLRCYVGRAGDDAIIHKSDEELVKLVVNDLKTVTQIDGDPEFTIVTRWPEAMPQYQVGHQEWLKQIDLELPKDYPNVYLIGSSFRGIGIPDCIKQGKETAERIVQGF